MRDPQYFEIQASDPAALVEFYRAAFGWQFDREDGMPIEYWRIITDGIRGGILQRPAKVPEPAQGANAFVVSMRVDDFDAAALAIVSAGAEVVMSKFAVPGSCWQGYFADPDQNVFGIFEVDENAA